MKKFNGRLTSSVLFFGIVLFFSATVFSDDSIAQDTANAIDIRLNKANQSLENEDYSAAILELIEVIKKQQELIEELKKAKAQQPFRAVSAGDTKQSEASRQGILRQFTSAALPFSGVQYSDAEEQWRKAYKIQHRAIFDLGRRKAIPVFEEAIKEYRILVENYPTSKRAPQAQRQIAWIYQNQLRDNNQARIEWNQLLQLYPNSDYAREAESNLRKLGDR